MLAEMQVNEGQSLRRELDALRNEALKGIYAPEGEMRTLAVAEAVEERDEDLVREFNEEATAGRAAAEALHTRLQLHAEHINGIRKGFKSVYGGLSDIDARHDMVQRQVDEQQAQEARRARADLGVLALARRIEERVDAIQLTVDCITAQALLLSQVLERLIDSESAILERISRVGIVVSASLAPIRSLSETRHEPRVSRHVLFRSQREDRKSRQERATAARAAPRLGVLRSFH